MSREAQLGIAVGKRGIGKTFTTLQVIDDYISGHGGKIKPRRVLIVDVNDEFENVKALKLEDVALFSRHPKIEARRIRPFHPDGRKMNITEIANTLNTVLDNFQGGLLLVEDINKYLTHNFPRDVIGAICTNRHNDCDIIMHYQAIGKVPTTVWQNANWLRFHQNTESVARHKNKFEDKFELFSIVECLVNFQCENGNERFYAWVDIDKMKVRGNFSREMAEKACEDYMIANYKKVVSPETKRLDLTGKPIYADPAEASLAVKKRLFIKFFSFD
jgi:hypothetical protein